MKNIPTLILSLFYLSGLSAQSIIYVDQNVQGGGQDGSSWANATPDLSLALDLAVAGDLIWVVAGTYLPTTTTDRGVSFYLKQGVRLYGGFTGDETGLLQRDYVINETILSGNIGDPASVSDNVFHVVRGIGLDSTTVLDGFTVTQGYAYNVQPAPFTEARGGGLLLEPSPLVPNTCPIIQNCRFVNNYASVGGAISCKWDFENLVNPILRNCQFVGNRAFSFGGAIYKGSPSDPARPFSVENCLFLKNRALGGEGGAVFLTDVQNSTVFRKCRFEKDTASSTWGGGIFYAGSSSTTNTLVLDSCIFLENYANEGTGFCYINAGPDEVFHCIIRNCSFERNRTNGGGSAAFYLQSFEQGKIILEMEKTNIISNRSNSNRTIFIDGNHVEAKLDRCFFYDSRHINNPNSSQLSLYIILSKGKTNLSNCTFAHNGAGVFIGTPEDGQVVSRITNCTFFSNGKYPFDKSWYNSFAVIDSFYNECYVDNCVFWESNTSNVFWNANPFEISAYGYHIDHSALSMIPTDTLMPGGSAAFGDHNIFRYAPPLFVDTLADDYRLLPCSPGVDAGDNAVVDTLGLVTDLDGNPRVFGGTVDMGAYETQDSCTVSGSGETFVATPDATLLPNPVGCGRVVRVQLAPSPTVESARWSVFDAGGKLVKTGTGSISSDGLLQVVAPERPGFYLLRIAGQRTPLKLIVQE